MSAKVATTEIGIASEMTTVLRTLRLWAGRHRQRRQLAALDAHLLKDIGLTREQARAVADKPFWRE